MLPSNQEGQSAGLNVQAHRAKSPECGRLKALKANMQPLLTSGTNGYEWSRAVPPREQGRSSPGPMAVLGGWAVSYERGTHVQHR